MCSPERLRQQADDITANNGGGAQTAVGLCDLLTVNIAPLWSGLLWETYSAGIINSATAGIRPS